MSRVLAGRALVRAGDRERAVAELQRAVEPSRGRRHPLPARRSGSFASSATGAAAHAAREPDETGISSLTGRELQLAMLVVDRKTNPEIAAELFLSQKTVESHLRNIFRKVGVNSRVELARAVERAGPSG